MHKALGSVPEHCMNWEWRCRSTIPTLGRWRQKDRIKVIPRYIMRPCPFKLVGRTAGDLDPSICFVHQGTEARLRFRPCFWGLVYGSETVPSGWFLALLPMQSPRRSQAVRCSVTSVAGTTGMPREVRRQPRAVGLACLEHQCLEGD